MWFDSLFKPKSDSSKMTDRLKNLNTKIVLCGHGNKNKFYNFEGILGVMGRSNLRANEDNGGYNLVITKNYPIYFFEKNNSISNYNLWLTVCLKKE